MVFAIATLVSALSISCVAAYFSIIGLATIFPGSSISVIVMGIVLEIGKIMAAVWLHRNWKTANFFIKSYLTFAVLVLMGITSMGIFGFLSKSHIEHQAQATHEVTLIETLETKIEQEDALIKQYEAYIASCQKRLNNSGQQSNTEIDREEKRISQLLGTLEKDITLEQSRIDGLTERRKELDVAVATLEASSGGLFSNKKQKLQDLRESQSAERDQIKESIAKYNTNIESFRSHTQAQIEKLRTNIESFRGQSGSDLTQIQGEIEKTNAQIRECMDRSTEHKKEKLKYGEKIRALETEIGPLRYVAKAVEDFGGSELAADTAVRIIILILMVVFDPLAILLVIAAHISLSKAFGKPYPKLSDEIKGRAAPLLKEEPKPEPKPAPKAQTEPEAQQEAAPEPEKPSPPPENLAEQVEKAILEIDVIRKVCGLTEKENKKEENEED